MGPGGESKNKAHQRGGLEYCTGVILVEFVMIDG